MGIVERPDGETYIAVQRSTLVLTVVAILASAALGSITLIAGGYFWIESERRTILTELRKAYDERDQLRDQLNAALKVADQKDTELARMELQLRAAVDQNRVTLQTAQDLRDQLRRVSEERDELRRERVDALAAADRAEMDRDRLLARVRSLEERIRSADEAVRSLETDNASILRNADVSTAQMTAELAAMADANDELQADLATSRWNEEVARAVEGECRATLLGAAFDRCAGGIRTTLHPYADTGIRCLRDGFGGVVYIAAADDAVGRANVVPLRHGVVILCDRTLMDPVVAENNP